MLTDVLHSETDVLGEGACRSFLNAGDIIKFANAVDVKGVEQPPAKQVTYNTAIFCEGLRKTYGINIGLTFLNASGDDVKTRSKAAAGSDAPMGGMPAACLHQFGQRKPGSPDIPVGN